MHAIRQGDADAFALLLGRHVDALFRYALRLCGSPDTAEDLVQETWLTVWTKAGSFKPRRARVTTWVHRILYHKFIDQHRKTHTQAYNESDLQADSSGLDVSPNAAKLNGALLDGTPLDAAAQEHAAPDKAWLHRALMGLPEQQRAAIVLAHAQGFNNKDIAHILGASVRAVESLLARARRSLRREYNHWTKGS